MKIYNFSAGPTKLPSEVISKASQAVKYYSPINSSILEISHRSSEFNDILENLNENFKKLFNLPSNFKILLLQGGATYQNTLISKNIPKGKKLGCMINGYWGLKSFKDFESEYQNIISYKFSKDILNNIQNFNFTDSDYLHITSNETIDGIQIRNFNNINHPKLIVDMSSDIGSYKFNFDNIQYIYAGAQKNLGIPGVTVSFVNEAIVNENNNSSYLNLKKLYDADSLLNTPSTYSIFVLKLMLEWMQEMGGIEYFEKQSIHQSDLLYMLLESQTDKINFLVDKEYRSRSNVVFNFKNMDLNQKFINYAKNAGIIGINGHRSVGGIRVSLYNSIGNKMFTYFINIFEKFLKSES